MEKSGGGAKSPVGFVVRFPDLQGEMAAFPSNFIARLRLTPGNESLYLAHLFAALYRARHNVPFIKQNTGIQNLDVPAYLTLHVPARSLDMQRSLAREAEDRLGATLALRATGDRLVAAVLAYRDSLIHEAVSGKLDVSAVSESQMDERLQAAIEGEPERVSA